MKVEEFNPHLFTQEPEDPDTEKDIVECIKIPRKEEFHLFRQIEQPIHIPNAERELEKLHQTIKGDLKKLGQVVSIKSRQLDELWARNLLTYTQKQTAAILGVTDKTVRNYIKRGLLERNEKTKRITRSSIEKLL